MKLSFSLTTAGMILFATVVVSAAEPPVGSALMQKYCFDCHAGQTISGDINFQMLLQGGSREPQSGTWLKAWKAVRQAWMPPAEHEQPTLAERQALESWIASEKLQVSFQQPDPGRVTIRRLNRLEYEFSVQDLLGVDLGAEQNYSSDIAHIGTAQLRLRDRLPPDETAFGFDNMGDFLTLPPALLERFFDIGEWVAREVIILDGPRAPKRILSAAQFAKRESNDPKRQELAATITAPHAGKYELTLHFTLGGWQEFGGAYDFAARVGKLELAQQRLEVGGYKKHRFNATVDLPAGDHNLSLVALAIEPDAKGNYRALDFRPALQVVGPLGAEFAEYPAAHRQIFFKGAAPTDPAARRAYASEILERLATRAFRRPVARETLNGLVELAAQDQHFESGIARALSAILTSPQFLFRAESQPRPNDPTTVHLLDEYALASRLSYLLWLSLPDEELLSLAGRGELRNHLAAQVQRMLRDPKSARFFEDFPGQWLRTRNVLMTPISTKAEAQLNPVRASMKRETELLFEHIARNDHDLFELITAEYSFLDRQLAEFYGVPEVPADGFHRVILPASSHRSGILTHGSFLVATSNPNRTSPVKRGLFVLENLFGIEPPPPPPNIPALDDVNLGDTSKKTGRELLALHRADQSCAACHAHFDPIGIALEHYDLIGKWRHDEDGLPIDSVERTVSGEQVGSVTDLQQQFLKRKDKFYRGITEKLLTYTLGRGLEPADSLTVGRITTELVSKGGKFSTLLQGIVDSPAFQMRRGDHGGFKAKHRDGLPSPPPPEKRRPPKNE